MSTTTRISSLVLAVGVTALAHAQPPAAAAAAKPVVVSGTVPDEATRSAILQRVREVYGSDRQVVDQLGVAKISAPQSWAPQVARLITPELRQVTQGELRIHGTTIEIEGQVANAAQQQKLGSQLNGALVNTTYSVRNGLRVGSGGQAQLDAALADRIVEFEPGKDTLTLAGLRILDDLLPVLQQFSGRRFEVIGHTDNAGPHDANVALSQARADAVKRYLVEHGMQAATIVTRGAGPDRPVADNATPQGRSRNRRIEFRVLA